MKGSGIFAVGKVESADASAQKFSPWRWHGITNVHRNARSAKLLRSHQTGRAGTDHQYRDAVRKYQDNPLSLRHARQCALKRWSSLHFPIPVLNAGIGIEAQRGDFLGMKIRQSNRICQCDLVTT